MSSLNLPGAIDEVSFSGGSCGKSWRCVPRPVSNLTQWFCGRLIAYWVYSPRRVSVSTPARSIGSIL